MIDLIKNSFTAPSKLSPAKKLPGRKVFLYLLLLAAIVVLPIFVESQRALSSMRNDAEDIAESIPDFEVVNGEMTMEEETDSFVYQSNTFLFFFDPHGEMTTDTITANTQNLGVPIGIGVMSDVFYLSLLTYEVSLPYSQLEGFSGNNLRLILTQVGTMNIWSALMALVILLIGGLFNVLFELLIYTLFASLISSFTRRRYRFAENWKIVMVAATAPFVVFSLLNIFRIYPFLQLEIKAVATLILYNIATKHDPEKPSRM